MHLLWESELVQKTAPLEVEVLLQVSGPAKLLTQTCRNKQAWEILSICSMTTGLSLLHWAWAASDGHPLSVLGSAQAGEENPSMNHSGQSIKGECANC